MVMDYIDDHVARHVAIHRAGQVSATAYLARQAALHPHLRDVSDPSVNGPSGVGYAWIVARGD